MEKQKGTELQDGKGFFPI